jgi:hypothetical protein
LTDTIRQKPIGLSSMVQVQSRLVALPERISCRMPQIASRPIFPKMMAMVVVGGIGEIKIYPRVPTHRD